MATCRECLHQELCDTYSRMGVTDVPADDITICELFTPKSDYVKRERGEWIAYWDNDYLQYSYKCSVCEKDALTKEETMHDQVLTPFCPYCGADMRKE